MHRVNWVTPKYHRYVASFIHIETALSILYGRLKKTGLKIRVVQVTNTMLTMSSQK